MFFMYFYLFVVDSFYSMLFYTFFPPVDENGSEIKMDTHVCMQRIIHACEKKDSMVKSFLKSIWGLSKQV